MLVCMAVCMAVCTGVCMAVCTAGLRADRARGAIWAGAIMPRAGSADLAAVDSAADVPEAAAPDEDNKNMGTLRTKSQRAHLLMYGSVRT